MNIAYSNTKCDVMISLKKIECAVHIHKIKKYIFVTNFIQVCADSRKISLDCLLYLKILSKRQCKLR